MAGASLSLEQQPIRDCGVCGSALCEHLVCRMCSICEACDPHAQERADNWHKYHQDRARAESEIASVRIASGYRTSDVSQINRRLDYLRQCGIAEQDLAEASAAVDNLKSDCCAEPCKRRKRSGQSFCSWCFAKLPQDLQSDLGLHLRGGYLTHYRRAVQILTGIRNATSNT
jgi:hypothetical protein